MVYRKITRKLMHFVSTLLLVCLPAQPLLSILNYNQVFNLDKIHRKYAVLLRDIGCYDNVFGEKEISSNHSPSIVEKHNLSDEFIYYMPITNSKVDYENNEQSLKIKTYQEECWRHLLKYKKRAALRPALVNGTIIIALGALTGGLIYVDHSAWTFTLLYFVCYSIFLWKEVVPSLANYFSPPNTGLDEYEKSFVQNQCFLPKALWQPLIDQFVLAAQSPLTQDEHIKFINFSLGLNAYAQKSLPELPPFKEIIQNLKHMLDEFFQDYDVDSQEIIRIGGRIATFIAQFYGQEPSVTCLYFSGEPGIGKTHFSDYLRDWFRKSLPMLGLYTENAQILEQKDLEGSSKNPGLILKSYQNVLKNKNKYGVFITIDEFSLDNTNLLNSFKRVFNGKRSKIPEIYLNEYGVEDINLPLLPMFVLFTNNEILYQSSQGDLESNSAVSSRLQEVSFPLPTEKALEKYALNHIKTSKFAEFLPNLFESDALKKPYSNEFNKALNGLKNFREVDKTLEVLLFKWLTE